jgi:GNAT superfamily N-acetyltransferase
MRLRAIEIRAARPDEAAAIAEAHVRADTETYTPIFGDRFRAVALDASLARWEAAFIAGDELLVAGEDGAIVGLIHASETWMSALYILASHHRRGLGRTLLRELARRLTARFVRQIGFQCVAENARALAFYEAMGAEPVGRKQEGEGADAWEEVVFRLELVASAALLGR